MAKGKRSSNSDERERKAAHTGYERLSDEEADRRAWAIVNKPDQDGKKSGSGRRRAKHD